MLWIMTMGRRLNGVYAAFMLVAFMMGVAGALQAPTLSLFLSREVGAQPFWVGLFYTVNAIVGIVVSLGLAKRSDSQGDRRKLIMFCCLMAIGNALLFAFNRHYLTLITCGVLLASLANTAMPQLFALAREYADNSAREVVMFSSVMRAQLSLAWVIGPPLDDHYGTSLSWVERLLAGTDKMYPRLDLPVVDVRDVADVVAACMVPGQGPRRYVVPGHHLNGDLMLLAQTAGQRIQARLVACNKNKIVATASKTFGIGGTDTAGGAGDKDGRKCGHVISLIWMVWVNEPMRP